ncbi:MAG: adenylate/guanylate cyclase domain-containing protein [Leptospiraceae bacterium]|nr:adenylate/guanylate cyclase domain-containing protein [Leptospiraceae bacterium]
MRSNKLIFKKSAAWLVGVLFFNSLFSLTASYGTLPQKYKIFVVVISIVHFVFFSIVTIYINYKFVKRNWSDETRFKYFSRYILSPSTFYIGIVSPLLEDFFVIGFFYLICGAMIGQTFYVKTSKHHFIYAIINTIIFFSSLIFLDLIGVLDVSYVKYSIFIACNLTTLYWIANVSDLIVMQRKQIQSLLQAQSRSRYELQVAVGKANKLLLNILPSSIAEELKETGLTQPVHYESASVLFTDFKGFTVIAQAMSPSELIQELDRCFSYFDQVCEKYGLEKLKTIGDAYMCAGGLPKSNKTHAIDVTLAALEMQSFMNQMKEIKAAQHLPYWEIRLGIHTGPLVAGVIGEKKFAYDIWGDTVNTASRMESSGTPGKVNISSQTYHIINPYFDCTHRGKIQAKNKGEIDMYYVDGIKPEFSREQDGRTPNEAFLQETRNKSK